MLKSLCKQLGILASPGLLLKAAGCGRGPGHRQKTVSPCTGQGAAFTPCRIVSIRITNPTQNQPETITTSADTMQGVLILFLSHSCVLA